MKTLQRFEKWTYPSILLWSFAAIWWIAVLRPRHPFETLFEAVVMVVLTAAATITALVGAWFAFRDKP